MLMYEMKEEYLTGIPQVDEEHTRIFELAEQAYQLLQDEHRYDKYDDLVHLVEELKSYTKYHFEHEEEYMESIHYKKLYTQKIQHEGFRRKLEELTRLDSIEGDQEDQDKVIDDILKFVTDWLVSHILHNDKLIGKL